MLRIPTHGEPPVGGWYGDVSQLSSQPTTTWSWSWGRSLPRSTTVASTPAAFELKTEFWSWNQTCNQGVLLWSKIWYVEPMMIMLILPFKMCKKFSGVFILLETITTSTWSLSSQPSPSCHYHPHSSSSSSEGWNRKKQHLSDKNDSLHFYRYFIIPTM